MDILSTNLELVSSGRLFRACLMALIRLMFGGVWVPTFIFPKWLQKMTVLELSSQALFFEVMAENADQRCSTFLLPQCGHCTSPSS